MYSLFNFIYLDYTKSLNAYRIYSMNSEKLIAIWIRIQKPQLFDKTFLAIFILYKFHDTLIEMNLNTHIFSQKIKLIVSSLYRNLPINPGTFFRLPNIFLINILWLETFHLYIVSISYDDKFIEICII